MREAFFPSSIQHYAVETSRPDDLRRSRRSSGATSPRNSSRWCTPGGTRSPAPSASRAARAARSSRSRSSATSPTSRGVCWRATRCARLAGAPAGQPRPPRPAGPGRPPGARLRDGRRAVAVPRRAPARHGARVARGGPGAAAHLQRRAAARCSTSSPRWATSRSRTRTTCARRRDLRPSSATWGRSRSPAGCRRWPPATCTSRPPCSTSRRASSSLDDRRIALSALECDLLRFLREREGRPVARATLLRDVWGHAWTGGSNVVDVAIAGLRRKLGDRAAALETVRGVGYRLQPL